VVCRLLSAPFGCSAWDFESPLKSRTVTEEVHHGDTEDTEIYQSLPENPTVIFSVFSVSPWFFRQTL